MGTSSSGPTLIQSVQRALRLLEVVAERDGRASAKELARAAGVALPTAYHLLRTLAHEGYLQRLEEGSYVLGQRLELVVRGGSAVRAVARARPILECLRDSLRSAVYLALYEQGEINIVDIVDSPKAPRIDLWVGIHDAAHATAVGKCVLRHLNQSSRVEYLTDHPMQSLTRYTTVDCRRLRYELDKPVPLAVDKQEYAVGVNCLAAPVLGPSFVGAIGVTVSPRHLEGCPDIREALTAAAARVSRALALP